MSTGEEPLEPDEFGMLPPMQQDPAIEPGQTHATYLSPDGFIVQPQESEEQFRTGLNEELRRNSLLGNHAYLDLEHPPYVYHQPRLRELRQTYNDMIETFGSLYAGMGMNAQVPLSEQTPEPPRNPYPSRAGWRESFVPFHEDDAPEVSIRPKGKIGMYDIVESNTTFADVGGNERAKGLLQEITHQFAHPELYEKWDVPVPKGVLLWGEPGTGKTMLARAFAGEAGAALVEIPLASIRSKFIGETEKNLKGVFDEAAKYGKPVVLFFDEINSLLPERSQLSPDHPDARMVETFLQAVDGLQSAKNIMVLGATNFPDTIDAAAARPGRLDQKVQVELPDKAACEEILAKQLLASERKAGRVLATDDLALGEVGGYLEGLTGAHIAEILNRVKRTMAQTERAIGSGAISLDPELEAIDFSSDLRDEMLISTADIIAMTVNYRLDLGGIPPKDQPGDDEPPTGIPA